MPFVDGRLRDAYVHLLVRHLEIAWRAGIEESLWNHCIYEFKQRVSGLVGRSGRLPTLVVSAPVTAQLVRQYVDFLHESAATYEFLVGAMQDQLRAAISRHRWEHLADFINGIRTSVARCLVRLGDLQRYLAEQQMSGADRSPLAARALYLLARQIAPHLGLTHHQLAKNDSVLSLACVASFARAVLARNPSPIARDNLSAFITKFTSDLRQLEARADVQVCCDRTLRHQPVRSLYHSLTRGR